MEKLVNQLWKHLESESKRATSPNVCELTMKERWWRAVSENDMESMQTLLKEGINVNLQDRRGWSALNIASCAGREAMCRLLLENKADVNFQDDRRITPLHWACHNSDEAICRLLLENKADVNLQCKTGAAVLHRACNRGNVAICRLLLEHKADVDLADDHGTTALHWACKKGDKVIIRLLLDYGAKELTDYRGRSPLEYASVEVYRSIVEVFIDHDDLKRP
jgi:ankyrin repeat protein